MFRRSIITPSPDWEMAFYFAPDQLSTRQINRSGRACRSQAAFDVGGSGSNPVQGASFAKKLYWCVIP
jgi:hypothetical protein